MKRVIAMIGLFIMSLPSLLVKAQDEGTYIDNLGAQDSSYMDEDLLSGVEQSSGSNSTVIIIVVAVVVIAAAVFFFMKKKKK
ncbi:LPXTG cell wall anchor domain-containing protein [uncultured Draconibacterium sp.]|uniref:LPXTG cell wall anchor domain-containing protein n=1 Tax=uncultured Draconibacterium sp. TaxID=1573823 RepID=UPI0025EA306F|nr:LPXTG cell wall anchor domain-containing protein [uncultured Draconibacterium sp.]